MCFCEEIKAQYILFTFSVVNLIPSFSQLRCKQQRANLYSNSNQIQTFSRSISNWYCHQQCAFSRNKTTTRPSQAWDRIKLLRWNTVMITRNNEKELVEQQPAYFLSSPEMVFRPPPCYASFVSFYTHLILSLNSSIKNTPVWFMFVLSYMYMFFASLQYPVSHSKSSYCAHINVIPHQYQRITK